MEQLPAVIHAVESLSYLAVGLMLVLSAPLLALLWSTTAAVSIACYSLGDASRIAQLNVLNQLAELLIVDCVGNTTLDKYKSVLQ